MDATRTGLADRLWAVTGLGFVVLFVGGVVAAGDFPAADVSVTELEAYTMAHRPGLRTLSACHAAAAVVLLVFAGRLRHQLAGAPEGLVALSFGGAALASGALLASALLFWTLADPALAGTPIVLGAVHRLSGLAGGVGILLGLALFIGCTVLIGRRTGGLPRWLGMSGLAVALVDTASCASLVAAGGRWGPNGMIPVLGAMLSFLWISATSGNLALRLQTRADRPDEYVPGQPELPPTAPRITASTGPQAPGRSPSRASN